MGVTSTGVTELRREIDDFSETQRQTCQGVAEATSERIANRARQLVRVRSGYTHDQIEVHHDPVKRQSQVSVGPTASRPGTPEHPPMLAVWLEFGTRYMTAKPFMRPALDAEQERYRRDLEAASGLAAEKAFR